MLKVGGENVAAVEVESFLSRHPAVAQCAVVGRPDARYEEVPVAFVELAPGATATAEELIAHCSGGLARYKVPREVRFVTEWPMSATKIQKFRLKQAAGRAARVRVTVTHVDAARLHDAAFRRDPIPVWRALRDEAPVFHDTVDNVWLLTRHADVAEAFDDRVHLSNRLYRRTLGVVFGPNLLQMDGAEHLRRRALVGPMLVGERLRTYVPLVEDVAAGIARDLEGREEIDLVKDVTNHLPGAVIMAILGLPREDHPVLFPWYEAMMAGLWEDDDLRARGAEAHRAFAEYLRPLLDARRRSPGDDLLSRLVASELPGRGDPGVRIAPADRRRRDD